MAHTFKVQVDEPCVILHVVGDLTLVPAVVLQGDVVDDHWGVSRAGLLQSHASTVRAEHTLLSAQSHKHILKLKGVRHFGPFDANAGWIDTLRLMVVTAGQSDGTASMRDHFTWSGLHDHCSSIIL